MLTPYQQAIANLYNQRSTTYDQGDFHPKLVDLLLKYLAIEPRQTVLDLATGTGLVAIEAAKKVSNEGHVIGVDMANLMLAEAQKKVKNLNLNNIEFLLADIENIDLHESKFDRITCCAAMVIFNDIYTVLARCHSWLKSKGKLGFNYWSETSFIEGYLLSKIAAKYNINFPHWQQKIGTEENCINLLKTIGFRNIETYRDQLGHYVDLETVKNKWKMMINFPVANDNLFPFQTLSKEQLRAAKQDYYQELETIVTPQGVWNEIMTITVIAEK
ncbi:MAG: methyltransferase domain-containing protein [Crocosphaera sp.]|nr:methyltransferase domain-containing protein [Crocosphaera sp.]